MELLGNARVMEKSGVTRNCKRISRERWHGTAGDVSNPRSLDVAETEACHSDAEEVGIQNLDGFQVWRYQQARIVCTRRLFRT